VFKWLKSSVNKIFSGLDPDRSLVHIDDDGFMDDTIQVNIEDIIAGETDAKIGKLYILSLTEFHHALGDMWDKREAKIFLLTEAVLRDNIGVGNRWEHRSKEIYVMLFPTLSQLEAEARTFEISEQLGLKIIGERFDGERRPHIRFAGVDPKEALNADGTLDITLLEKAGREGESADRSKSASSKNTGDYKIRSAKDAQNDNPKDLGQDPDWRANQHENIPRPDKWKDNPHAHQDINGNWHENEHLAHQANTDWKERHHQSGIKSDPNWKEDHKEHKKADEDIQWVSISKTGEKKITESQPAAQTSSYSLTFEPCWNRASESLNSYKAILNYEANDGNILEGDKAYARFHTAEQLLKIDLWCLQNVVKSLFPLITKKVITPIFVPIHSSSLKAPMIDGFIANLNKFSATVRENYFTLQIIDDGNWEAENLKETVSMLKNMGLSLAFAPSPLHDFTAPLCQGLNWVGLDLASLSEIDAITPERLQRLQDEITQIGAQSYIFGISKRSQLGEMLDLGASLLSGPALVKTTRKLRPAFALAIERLQKAAQI
jgi:hypothetical protein